MEDQDELYFQSASWVRRALLQNENNAEGLYLMAKLYEEGYAIDKNLERAHHYYTKASENGLIKSFTKLGHFSYSGCSSESYRIP